MAVAPAAAAASLANPVAVPAVASLVRMADLDPLAAASLVNLAVEADPPAADLATMDTVPETVTETDMEADMEATVKAAPAAVESLASLVVEVLW